MELLLHATTKHQYDALKQTKPHAVLITGEEGVGKATLASSLAANLLGVELHNYPYFLEIIPDKQIIGIEQIRHVHDFLKRKTTGRDILRRAIIIQDGHLMTTEAQNALLKHLEEPPADTVIIVTASDITKLLPTIRSRAQQIHVVPVSLQQAKGYFDTTSEKELTSAFYMSDGRVGLMCALLNNDATHILVNAINDAKDLLRMDQYSKLTRVDALSKQKDTLPLLLTGMQRILASGLKHAISKQSTAQTRSFYHSIRAVYGAQEAPSHNANTKLLLTDLFMHLS